jgi:two-component system, cell cycle sensor histidine kinase and response regulator CckA
MRRMYEAALAGEERFRLMSSAASDALWDWDLVSDRLWWSDSLGTLFGYAPDAVAPTIDSWIAMIHPDDRDRTVESVTAAITRGQGSWRGEYRLIDFHGQTLWVADRGDIIRDVDGTPVRMVGGMRDVTAAKEAEQAALERAALLERTSECIVVRDLDQRIVYVNPAAEALYGATTAELAGRSPVDVLSLDAQLYAAASEALRRDGVWTGDLDAGGPQGRIIDCHWSLVRDDRGTPRSVLAIEADATARRRAQRHVLRAQRLESLGALAGGIAHDLNNMLTPIVMGLQLLQLENLEPSQRELLDTMADSARRAGDLAHQVLDFARGTEPSGANDACRVNDVLDELRRILRETFPVSITCTVDDTPGPVHVPVNHTQMLQVLLNLCVNARDAMPDGGAIAITARACRAADAGGPPPVAQPPDPQVVITVADDGIGMSPEVIEHLWEPFFTTKAPGVGTGLGLPTSAAIVQNAGGRIDVDTQEGRGSTFTVILPLAAEVGDGEGGARAERPVDRGANEVILIVDDEQAVRAVAERALRGAGYDVVAAADGEAALTVVRARSELAVLITDLMMPNMSGDELVNQLQTVRPDLPVLVTSGLHPQPHAPTTAYPYLSKPYTTDELLEAVRTLLRQRLSH